MSYHAKRESWEASASGAIIGNIQATFAARASASALSHPLEWAVHFYGEGGLIEYSFWFELRGPTKHAVRRSERVTQNNALEEKWN